MCRGNTSKKRGVQLKRKDQDKILLFSMILRKEDMLNSQRNMKKRSDMNPYLMNQYRRKFKALLKIVRNFSNKTNGTQDKEKDRIHYLSF